MDSNSETPGQPSPWNGRPEKVDEVVWSLEQIESALRADGAGLLEARVGSFVAYVEQLFDLHNRLNRQRGSDHDEESEGRATP